MSVAIALALALGVVAVVRQFAPDEPTRSAAPAPTITVAREALPGSVSQLWHGAGVLRVPTQLPAGRYVVGTYGDALGCFWRRMRTPTGKGKNDLIQQGAFNRGGSAQFTTSKAEYV
jgi:hypothetical protein